MEANEQAVDGEREWEHLTDDGHACYFCGAEITGAEIAAGAADACAKCEGLED